MSSGVSVGSCIFWLQHGNGDRVEKHSQSMVRSQARRLNGLFGGTESVAGRSFERTASVQAVPRNARLHARQYVHFGQTLQASPRRGR